MSDEHKHEGAAEQVVHSLKKEFTIVGKHRVHSWYAWAIVGIVFGMALAIVYVANRSVQFSPSFARYYNQGNDQLQKLYPGMTGPLVGITEPKIVEVIEKYRADNPLRSAAIQFTNLAVLNDQAFLEFNPAQWFDLDMPGSWSMFTTELSDANSGKRPFELIMNPNTADSLGTLFVGKNVEQRYLNFFPEFAALATVPDVYRCVCQIAITYDLERTPLAPNGNAGGPTEVISTGNKAKIWGKAPQSCTPGQNNICTVENYCLKLVTPKSQGGVNPDAGEPGEYVKSVNVQIDGEPGPNNGTCQTVIKMGGL